LAPKRSWHQNIDKPKTEKSKCKLAIAGLTWRIQDKVAKAKKRIAGRNVIEIKKGEAAA